MTMLADIEAVKRMLRASPDTAFDADNDARLNAINEAVSAAFEQRVGRTFATGETEETRTFTAGADGVLLFDRPLVSINAVSYGGTWNGLVYGGPTVLTASEYRLDRPDRRGRAYRLLGPWPKGWAVTVTGVWLDTDTATTVPSDVIYAVSYLVAERWKLENASPAGFTGPDGATIPLRNAWKDPIVVQAIEHYGATCAVSL